MEKKRYDHIPKSWFTAIQRDITAGRCGWQTLNPARNQLGNSHQQKTVDIPVRLSLEASDLFDQNEP